jgi:hypothetical protein
MLTVQRSTGTSPRFSLAGAVPATGVHPRASGPNCGAPQTHALARHQGRAMPLAFMASARPDPQDPPGPRGVSRQARARAVSLPAQCPPPPRTSAPAVHAPPASGAAPGPAGAARPGGPALESPGQLLPPGEPPRLRAGADRSAAGGARGRAASRAPQRWSAGTAATGGQKRHHRRQAENAPRVRRQGVCQAGSRLQREQVAHLLGVPCPRRFF